MEVVALEVSVGPTFGLKVTMTPDDGQAIAAMFTEEDGDANMVEVSILKPMRLRTSMVPVMWRTEEPWFVTLVERFRADLEMRYALTRAFRSPRNQVGIG